MSKKLLASLAVAAAAVYATSAGASTTFATGTSVTGADLGVIPLVTFEEGGVPVNPSPSVTPSGPFSVNGASFSGNGIVTNGNLANIYASPLNDATNYLAVVAASSGGALTPETITLPGSFTQFGFYWGSIDKFNKVTFSNGDSFTNLQNPPPANGGQSDPAQNLYVLFTSTVAFSSVTFDTSGNSFELDNLFWGPPEGPNPVPLPGALPLLASGLGGLGFLRFWRKRKSALKMAAA